MDSFPLLHGPLRATFGGSTFDFLAELIDNCLLCLAQVPLPARVVCDVAARVVAVLLLEDWVAALVSLHCPVHSFWNFDTKGGGVTALYSRGCSLCWRPPPAPAAPSLASAILLVFGRKEYHFELRRGSVPAPSGRVGS